MLAIGMPGPFEWIIILVFLVVIFGGLLLLVRVSRLGARPPEPRDSDRRDPPAFK